MTTFGVSLARVGRSAAGARIEAKGREYEQLQADLLITGAGRALLLTLSDRLERCGNQICEDMDAVKARVLKYQRGGIVHAILKEVARKHDIPVIEILSDRRAKRLVKARHEVMYRAVMETTASLPVIGRMLNRDHTSIGHGVMNHARTTGAPIPRGMQDRAYGRKRKPKT